MSSRIGDVASFTATDDALVLAAVSSPAELELLNDWLAQQRREHPETKVEVLQLPAENDPAAAVVGPARRPARRRRRPHRGAGTRVLGARWPAHSVKLVAPDVRPRHLPSAADAADVGSCTETRHGPEWSRVNRRRYPNFANSGKTRRAATIHVTSPGSCCGARRWPSNASNCGCSGRNTSRRS